MDGPNNVHNGPSMDDFPNKKKRDILVTGYDQNVELLVNQERMNS